MFISILLISLHRIHSNLFIILLEGCKVLPGLRELSLLHSLSNVPVDKGPLGVHQVKLVVQPGPGLSDGGGVGEHADSSGNFGQVPIWHYSRRLIVDTNLEPSGTPVNKLDASLGLDSGDGSIDIFGDHITSVEHAAGHVLA